MSEKNATLSATHSHLLSHSQTLESTLANTSKQLETALQEISNMKSEKQMMEASLKAVSNNENQLGKKHTDLVEKWKETQHQLQILRTERDELEASLKSTNQQQVIMLLMYCKEHFRILLFFG